MVSSVSPLATTTGEPPAAVQPAADPPTACGFESDAVRVPDPAGAPCASGDVVTPGAGAACVVLLANGLENGLSLWEKRVTSDEHPDRKRRPSPASARRGKARPLVPATQSLIGFHPRPHPRNCILNAVCADRVKGRFKMNRRLTIMSKSARRMRLSRVSSAGQRIRTESIHHQGPEAHEREAILGHLRDLGVAPVRSSVKPPKQTLLGSKLLLDGGAVLGLYITCCMCYMMVINVGLARSRQGQRTLFRAHEICDRFRRPTP